MVEIINFLENKSISNYYDVACGDGWFTSIVLKSCKQIDQITGIDITSSFEEGFYKNTNKKNAKFIKNDINKFSFADKEVDCMSMSLSIHHIENIESIINKIYKKLDKDGLFIAYEMINDNLTPSQKAQRQFHHLKGSIDRDNGEFHRDVFSIEEIKNMIKSAGFNIIYEDFELNNDKCNRSPKVIENITAQILKKTTSVYKTTIPSIIEKEIADLIENITKHGFAPPPLYLCIGKK